MSSKSLHLVANDLKPLVTSIKEMDLKLENQLTLNAYRDVVKSLSVLQQQVPNNVTRNKIIIKLRDGSQSKAILYKNNDPNHANTSAGLVHIHGGGLVMGLPESNDSRHLNLCSKLGITILAISYRKAPEYPYPTPLNDCKDGFDWFHANAESLKVNVNRIALSGDSAGGCLAAALSQLKLNDKTNKIAHLLLLYPMLDASTGTEANKKDPLLGEFIWTAEMNQFGWSAYLNGQPHTSPAVPASLKSYTGLPSCWIGVGTLDLFLDENIEYARKLIKAGVKTEFDIYPAAIHGFPKIEQAQSTIDFIHDFSNSLIKALKLTQ